MLYEFEILVNSPPKHFLYAAFNMLILVSQLIEIFSVVICATGESPLTDHNTSMKKKLKSDFISFRPKS